MHVRRRLALGSTAFGLLCSGCFAGYGTTAGPVVDTGGNVAIVARGWYHNGSWVNRDVSEDKSAQWGMVIAPSNLEVGAGYDVSRGGLRLELAIPIFGLVRAPLDENGRAVSTILGGRMAVTVWDGHKDTYFMGGGYVSLGLSSVRSLRLESSERSDWDDPRAYRTAGLRLELSLGGGSEWGSAYLGPQIEKLNFYHVYLSEGPDESDPCEQPPPNPCEP